TGLLVGSLFDLDDLDETESVLSEMSGVVRTGRASVLAEVDEQSDEVLDSALARLGGTVTRESLYDVESEIAVAEEAHRAAKKEARRQLHEQRREQRKEKVEQKIAELKAKLHIGQPAAAAKS